MSFDFFGDVGNLFSGGDSSQQPTQNLPVDPTVNASMPAPAPSGAAVPGQATASPGLVSPDTAGGGSPGILSQIGSWLGNNGSTIGKVVSPLIAGGGLINSIISNNKIPQKAQIANIAGQQVGAAQPMITGGENIVNQANAGQLPQGQETALDQQLQQQIAQIQAQYASMGLGGSTMEQQAVQQAQDTYQANKAQEVQQYLASGVAEENAGTGDLNSATQNYGLIAQEQMAQNQQLSQSIANFVKAMAGGGANNKTTSLTD